MSLEESTVIFVNVTASNITKSTGMNPSSHGRSTTSFYIALALLYVPGLVTNVLALRLIIRDIRFVDIPTNMLLFSLCLTDLVAICNSLIWHTIRRVVPTLTFGFCAVKSFFGPFFPLFSGLVSALMAVDRFAAFICPYKYTEYIKCKTWRITVAFMAVALGLLCTFPHMGLGQFWIPKTRNGKLIHSCSSLSYHKDSQKNIFILAYVFIGIAVVATIVICNTAVLVALLKMRKRISTPAGADQDRTIKSLEAEFAKIVGILTCAFLVCWTPYHVSI